MKKVLVVTGQFLVGSVVSVTDATHRAVGVVNDLAYKGVGHYYHKVGYLSPEGKIEKADTPEEASEVLRDFNDMVYGIAVDMAKDRVSKVASKLKF